MVYVSGGNFWMGATEEQKKFAEDDEKPKINVTLFSYYIGETEVTQDLWQAVMGNNPSRYKSLKRPVEQVSWEDCQLFIEKLNHLSGERFRLPTESEWEYAARGGKNSPNAYSGSYSIDSVAVYWKNSGDSYILEDDKMWNRKLIEENNGRTHYVATKRPNELGIYDMSGNVWEWCQDYYGKYRKHKKKEKWRITNIDLTNNLNEVYNPRRIIRGGAWDDDAGSCRVSCRGARYPDQPHFSVGFRLALF